MKLIGAAMIMLSTTWIGYAVSNKYAKREVQLKQLIFSFHMMDAEIYYHQTILQQTFKILSEKTIFPINYFYQSLVEELNRSVSNLAFVWESHVQKLEEVSALKEDEIAVLKQFGMTIGDYPLHKQHEQIIVTTKYLEQIMEQALEDRRKYGKLFYRFGIFTGIFIVLLFL